MANADFSIGDVLAWARTKPADEWYDYSKPTGCALCQFLNETGRTKRAVVDPWGWADTPGLGRHSPLDPALNDAVLGRGVDENHEVKWTFGKLVKRLERLCPETVVTRSNWSRLDAYLTDIEDVARERCSA